MEWIEAKPFALVKSEQAVSFFRDIIYCFRVPNAIITDNSMHITRNKFFEFCNDFNIRVDWAAVAHPQTNGQVERANGKILQGLKPRIFDQLKKFAGQWTEEVPSVLWSLHTTPN